MTMRKSITISSFVFFGILLFLSCSDEQPVSIAGTHIVSDITWTKNGDTISKPDGVVTMRVTTSQDDETRTRNIPYSAGSARIGPYPIGTVIDVLWERWTKKNV